MIRRSKRAIDRRLEELSGGASVPELSVAQFLSGDWTPVRDEPLLYRDPSTGALGRIPSALAAALAPDEGEGSR